MLKNEHLPWNNPTQGLTTNYDNIEICGDDALANHSPFATPDSPELSCIITFSNPLRPQDGYSFILQTGMHTALDTQVVCTTLTPDPSEQQACLNRLDPLTSPNGKVEFKVTGTNIYFSEGSIFEDLPSYDPSSIATAVQNSPFTQQESFWESLEGLNTAPSTLSPEKMFDSVKQPEVLWSIFGVIGLALAVSATGVILQARSIAKRRSSIIKGKIITKITEASSITEPLVVTKNKRPATLKTLEELKKGFEERDRLAQDAMKDIPE